jgi:protein involved in polysaccharide export with SLBB domain
MGSLASRILGGELLTLQEFAHEVATRLAYEMAAVAVTQPRPEIVAVSPAGTRPIEFNLQPSYRAYQKDPRSKDQIIQRVMRWIEAGTRQR